MAARQAIAVDGSGAWALWQAVRRRKPLVQVGPDDEDEAAASPGAMEASVAVPTSAVHRQLREHGHHGQRAAGRWSVPGHGARAAGDEQQAFVTAQGQRTAWWRVCVPVQAHSLDEVEDFVAIASVLLINMGTLSSEWIASKKLAAQRVRPGHLAWIAEVQRGQVTPPGPRTSTSAHRRRTQAVALGKPWVLDPVGCGATPNRTRACLDLLRCKPTVVRGNASEILALAGAAGGCDVPQARRVRLLAARSVSTQSSPLLLLASTHLQAPCRAWTARSSPRRRCPQPRPSLRSTGASWLCLARSENRPAPGRHLF